MSDHTVRLRQRQDLCRAMRIGLTEQPPSKAYRCGDAQCKISWKHHTVMDSPIVSGHHSIPLQSPSRANHDLLFPPQDLAATSQRPAPTRRPQSRRHQSPTFQPPIQSCAFITITITGKTQAPQQPQLVITGTDPSQGALPVHAALRPFSSGHRETQCITATRGSDTSAGNPNEFHEPVRLYL